MHVPDPARWLWYAFGGRLPRRYREWVLRDATGPHWQLRYAAQVVVRSVPFLVLGFTVLVLLPGVSPAMALAAVLAGLVITLYLTLTSAKEFRQVRLVQHGYPPRTRHR